MITLSLVCCLVLLSRLSHACVELSGIGDGQVYSMDDLSEYPIGSVRRTMLAPLTGRRVPNTLEARETPIIFRTQAYYVAAMYNILTYYDETALELWARQDVMNARRFCQPSESLEHFEDSDLFDLHRAVAYGYAIYYSVTGVMPETMDDGNAIINSSPMNLDSSICDNGNCDNDLSTPWGIGYAVAQELLSWADNDGWNEDGSLERQFNKVPFSDWRVTFGQGYEAVNTPWRVYDYKRWQPLREFDEFGYIVYQDHVVPHIGYTGKSIFFSNDEFCQRSEQFKNENECDYSDDYQTEMQAAIDRLANLDDLQKMLIETFDNKNVLTDFRSANRRALGYELDSLEFSAINLMDVMTLLEGILAVWKEKVDFDRIRPPSVIHELLADTEITSYAGTTVDGESYGTQTFAANEWEPYIRTMPHSEYPSASACVCEAYKNGYIEYFGWDNFTHVVPDGVTLSFDAFTSEYEPLSTPSEPVSYTFYSYTEISDICGESRLWGGMHFDDAVDDGRILCASIGNRVAQTMKSILNGEKPEFMVDVTDHSLNIRDCYPDDETSASSDE